MKKCALILIDIQNIYFTQGSYLLCEPEKAARNAKKILQLFREKNMPVIHVRHRFKTGGYSESPEYLNDIYEEVKPLANEKVIEKTYPNAFINTDLLEYLRQIKAEKLVIAGMMSHMCIDTTVRACQNYGYEVIVAEDACTTKSLKFHKKTIKAEDVHETFMSALNGMFANVIDSENIVRKLR